MRHANRFLFVVLFAASFAPFAIVAQDAAKTPKPAQKLDVQEFQLENGLKVLVAHRPGVPVVSSYVWYQVGSMDEVRGNTGMAHFLEHMMFKGSKHYKVGEVDQVTVRNGGSNNAFTSNDFTAYYIDLPKSRYKEALKIEVDRMRHLTLDLTEFESEKKVVQSESDIYADDPNDQFWAKLSASIHPHDHPYAHPVLGWPQDVQDITRRDMRLFYEKHYWPNQAILVLSGDITVAEAKPVVTDMFGAIPRGPELNRPKPRDFSVNGPIVFEHKHDSSVVEFGRQYLTARAGHADQAALDLLGIILGGGVTSRLYREVVETRQVATAIASGHMEQMLSGSMWMWAQMNEGRDRVELTDAIQAVVEGVQKQGVTNEELERAKNRFISSTVFGQESASDIASALGQSQIVNGDWNFVLNYPELVRKVTAADVQRVARKYLLPASSATGWMLPELSDAESGVAITDAQPQPLDIKRHVLGNGMTVLLLERRGLPIVSLRADVRASRAFETAAECGLASFTGALLDAGTQNFTKQQLAEAMENVGGSLSVDATGASSRVLSQYADLALKLSAECLQRPSFPVSEIELMRGQYIAALENAKNETSWFARAAANAALYGPEHSMGRNADGTEATLKAFTRESVLRWHSTWFRPDNVVLSVVGDFSAPDMLKQIEAHYGGWARPAAPLKHPDFEFSRPASLEGQQVFHFRNFDSTKVSSSAKRIAIDHPAKDQCVVRLQTIGVRRNNPDYYALMVMDGVLGTSPGFTDRFSKVLRDQMGLAYSAYANIASGSGMYQGSFIGYIGTRPDNVEKALKVMYALVDQIRTEPVTEQELTNVKDYLKGSFVFDIESTGQLAGMLIQIERYQLGNDYLVKYSQAIDKVTAADVQRVAAKYLVPGSMVEVICGPVEKITAPVEDEGVEEGGEDGSEGGK